MPWLMKAEPDSRIVKGKDVKFSVDDFEAMGLIVAHPQDFAVGCHEAKKIMKEKMKIGDRVLFYHSNTKEPGVYALATVAKEGYPDYTAWDPSHPYYDEKSKEQDPTWFMVDVKFASRLPHPPSLALVKYLAGLSSSSPPEEVDYIGQNGLNAIKSMQLVNRGRLSVQVVEEAAYDAVVQLGTKGGWESLVVKSKGKGKVKTEPNSEVKAEVKTEAGAETVAKAEGKGGKRKSQSGVVENKEPKKGKKANADVKTEENKSSKPSPMPTPPTEGSRRSKRIKA